MEGGAAAAIAALGPGEVPGRRGGRGRRAGLDGLGRGQRWRLRAAPGHRRRTGGGLVGAGRLADLDWPVEPEGAGEALAAVRWLAWEPLDFTLGWGLHLAGELPGEGFGFAVAASDARREADAGRLSASASRRGHHGPDCRGRDDGGGVAWGRPSGR